MAQLSLHCHSAGSLKTNAIQIKMVGYKAHLEIVHFNCVFIVKGTLTVHCSPHCLADIDIWICLKVTFVACVNEMSAWLPHFNLFLRDKCFQQILKLPTINPDDKYMHDYKFWPAFYEASSQNVLRRLEILRYCMANCKRP